MYNKMMLPIQLTKILYESWQGQISVSSEDSQIYGKCLNGHGKVTFKNGNQYQGQFYNGLLHGKGKFIWSNHIQYEGQFTDNRITGSGVYKWPDNSVYEGDVKDGLRHGNGKYTIQQATYQGEWLDGKKHGKGKIIFKSGSIFQGQFINDLKQGYGKMYYYPSGNYFQGNWKNDKKQGQGTMNWTDIREKYVGQWKNNHQEGWGMHIWLESKGQGKYIRNRYQGHWVNGVRDGYGVFYYANGSKYQGFWKQNMKQGFSFYTNQNGRTQLISFKKDRMIRNNLPSTIQQSSKKTINKKQVQPNFYSLCLKIQSFYHPFHPNLEQLYNYLLRNNTNLKSWYKGISTFYDQQSEYSFCLNLQGAWKMIRSLKILGNFGLATLNRGLFQNTPQVKQLLNMVQLVPDSIINYQDIYYKNQASNSQKIDFSNPIISQQNNIQFPFDAYNVHDRQKNILFRQFIQLIVCIGAQIDPTIDKPQKAVQKIVGKISPFLQNISKMAKTGMNINQAVSDNKSSISKTQKNISPFYKNINEQLLKTLVGGQTQKFKKKSQLTIKVKDLLMYGKLSGVIGQAQLLLLQKVFQKYNDSEVINNEKSPNWQGSSLSSRILNMLNYQLIEYQFSEIIYILLIKKIGSQKQTEQNKRKYVQLITQFSSIKPQTSQSQKKQLSYASERRVFVSKKQEEKIKLKQRRRLMEIQKAQKQQKMRQIEREQKEMAYMSKEDFDVKLEDFDEQESQFEI